MKTPNNELSNSPLSYKTPFEEMAKNAQLFITDNGDIAAWCVYTVDAPPALAESFLHLGTKTKIPGMGLLVSPAKAPPVFVGAVKGRFSKEDDVALVVIPPEAIQRLGSPVGFPVVNGKESVIYNCFCLEAQMVAYADFEKHELHLAASPVGAEAYVSAWRNRVTHYELSVIQH